MDIKKIIKESLVKVLGEAKKDLFPKNRVVSINSIKKYLKGVKPGITIHLDKKISYTKVEDNVFTSDKYTDLGLDQLANVMDQAFRKKQKVQVEEHVVTFTKDEMSKLHKDGKITKKDEEGKDHDYVYNEEFELEKEKMTDPDDMRMYNEVSTLGASKAMRIGRKLGWEAKKRSSGRTDYVTFTKDGKEYGPVDANVLTNDYLIKKLSETLNEADIKKFEKNLDAMVASYVKDGLKLDKEEERKAFVELKKLIKTYSFSKMKKLRGEGINEASLSKVYNAARKGSYPITLVAIEKGKVVDQKLVGTPEIVPAAFNDMQKEFPKAQVNVEDRKGKILFKEVKLTEEALDIGNQPIPSKYFKKYMKEYSSEITQAKRHFIKSGAWPIADKVRKYLKTAPTPTTVNEYIKWHAGAKALTGGKTFGMGSGFASASSLISTIVAESGTTNKQANLWDSKILPYIDKKAK